MTSGIHHVTLITNDVQANVDFYVGFLGLRLVKQTGGYEDARQLHLFYGDEAATPGSLITFLVWQGGSGRSAKCHWPYPRARSASGWSAPCAWASKARGRDRNSARRCCGCATLVMS
jgi:catechol 2,3-dioxygenase-like lactoylglutathione lyase family enzyme